MKHVHEYRDPGRIRVVADQIARVTTRPWTLMEVCGGQTHAIIKYGLDELLPEAVRLIHGPGCPVCVTPVEVLDRAHDIAARPEVIFCTFGDMLRVPGSSTDLYQVKARGGDVRIVYSPMDAVALAQQHPDRQVVFLAVGFETTAPANAMAAQQARQQGLGNFSLLVSHALVPPALECLMQADDCQVQGFLAAGHVCAVMGVQEYPPIAARYRVPIVVTGFEPLDILQGVLLCLRQLEEGRYEVENQYSRAVQTEGNRHARALIQEVFAVTDRDWRGIGRIPASGFGLSEAYRDLDARQRFDETSSAGGQSPAPGDGSHQGLAVAPGAAPTAAPDEATECLSGEILQGRLRPTDCPAFGTRCTPEHPLGATMVSDEGACAAYHRFRPAAT